MNEVLGIKLFYINVFAILRVRLCTREHIFQILIDAGQIVPRTGKLLSYGDTKRRCFPLSA